MALSVFDAHAHAFPDHVAAGAMKALEGGRWMQVTGHTDGTLAGLLASMDRAGIAKAMMCSVATKPSQVTKITDWSASIASDRIIPFASIHPDFDQPEAEAKRMAKLGIRGIKFHPQYMTCALDDPRTIRIARAAADAGLAMQVHAGYDLAFEYDELAGPRQVVALHEAVPELRLLACHLGGWRRWEEVVEHVAGRAIYLETSFVLGQCPDELLHQILARHDAQYLLFGTDSPWADQAAELAAFRALPLTEDLKHQVLWTNPHRFVST